LQDITEDADEQEGEVKEISLGEDSCRAKFKKCVLIPSSRANFIWDKNMFMGASECMLVKLKKTNSRLC